MANNELSPQSIDVAEFTPEHKRRHLVLDYFEVRSRAIQLCKAVNIPLAESKDILKLVAEKRGDPKEVISLINAEYVVDDFNPIDPVYCKVGELLQCNYSNGITAGGKDIMKFRKMYRYDQEDGNYQGAIRLVVKNSEDELMFVDLYSKLLKININSPDFLISEAQNDIDLSIALAILSLTDKGYTILGRGLFTIDEALDSKMPQYNNLENL